MGYPLSSRGRVRTEAPVVSSPAFIVRLCRLWAGRLLLAFLAILGSSPVLAQMQVYYVHSDHLNTPRRVTDEHNTVLWQNPPLSEPFGLMPPEEDPDGDGRQFILNLRFPGQYFDTESSTHYNFFRDYDLLFGRYLQSDPIGLDGGINTYSYVENRPTMMIDPEGLQAIPVPFPYIPGFPLPGNRPPKSNDPSNLLAPPKSESPPFSWPDWTIKKNLQEECKNECDEIEEREVVDCEWRYKMGGRSNRESVRACIQMARDRWIQCYKKCQKECK